MIQMLVEGFLTSLQIFAWTLIGALPLGVAVVLLRTSRFAVLRGVTRAYISVMRGTPLMLQMFAIYFMPFYVFGIQLSPASKWQATIAAFIINYAAYFAEILSLIHISTQVTLASGEVISIPGGYLDIGIHDTMADLIVNLIGALAFAVLGFAYVKTRDNNSFAARFIPRVRKGSRS